MVNSNINQLNSKIEEFKKKFHAKIENNFLKLNILETKNYNRKVTMKVILNELRVILDNYTVRTFKFSNNSKEYEEKEFYQRLDQSLDDPDEVILDEKHIPKSDEVRFKLKCDEFGNKSCVIYGPNREVNCTYRLLYGFNSTIIPLDKERSKDIDSSFEENDQINDTSENNVSYQETGESMDLKSNEDDDIEEEKIRMVDERSKKNKKKIRSKSSNKSVINSNKERSQSKRNYSLKYDKSF